MKTNKYLSHLIKASLLCIICIFLYSCPEKILLSGDISGTVTDANSGGAIEGVLIKLDYTMDSTLTDSSGSYLFENLTSGSYVIQASKVPLYIEKTETVEVLPGQTIVKNILLVVGFKR